MNHEEYASYDALGLAELVRKAEVTPSELLTAALARTDAVNETLNAVVHRMDETARAAASGDLPAGPFTGVPFMVKDMDGELAGEPCTSSSRALRTYVPEQDSELFARYRKAGVVFAGKTNCPELGIMGVTESELRGPALNPWNTGHTPGGSSGGSGAAVAAGIVPVAHAGDGGGSIRIPASACGLFGLKPSRGLTPLGPNESEPWQGLVVRHVVTKSVRDSAAFLDAGAGADLGAPYAAPVQKGTYLAEVGRKPGKLRIAYSTASMLGKTIHPECVTAVENAAQLLADLGHEVFEMDLPLNKEELAHAYLAIVAASVATDVLDTERKTGKKVNSGDFEQPTWFLRQVGDVLTARELEQARQGIQRHTRSLAQLFADDFDVHLSATMAYPPVRIGELAVKPQEKVALGTMRRMPITPGPMVRLALAQLAANSLEKTANTMIYNMTGQPAMSVPLHWAIGGLPVGVQLAGGFGTEGMLLRLAAQLEEAQPWEPKLRSKTLTKAF